MRLPSTTILAREALDEFDVWITPSIGDIQATDKFKEELRFVADAFEIIGAATACFAGPDSFRPDSIADAFVGAIAEKTVDQRERILQSLASTLFAVTGKSDNNFKCQFPLYLRDEAGWTGMPVISKEQTKDKAAVSSLPRVLKSKSYMSLIARVQARETESRLLREIISFLLRDRNAVNQLWSLGYSYFALKEFGRSTDLLAPLVIFKIRGSVIASGGHQPESLLRGRLAE